MKKIFYLSALLISVSVWSKPILNLECIVESGYAGRSFDLKIDFDKKKVSGLFGVSGNLSRTYSMELDLFRETDNSYDIRQKPVNNEGLVFNWDIQMRWTLNRSTGKLMGEEWDDRHGWQSSVKRLDGHKVIASCSKVNSEKLF